MCLNNIHQSSRNMKKQALICENHFFETKNLFKFSRTKKSKQSVVEIDNNIVEVIVAKILCDQLPMSFERSESSKVLDIFYNKKAVTIDMLSQIRLDLKPQSRQYRKD